MEILEGARKQAGKIGAKLAGDKMPLRVEEISIRKKTEETKIGPVTFKEKGQYRLGVTINIGNIGGEPGLYVSAALTEQREEREQVFKGKVADLSEVTGRGIGTSPVSLGIRTKGGGWLSLTLRKVTQEEAK